MCDNPLQWDLAIPQAKFSLNCNINRSTIKYSFQIVYGTNPKRIVNIVDLLANPYTNLNVTIL
jgi:hypothetical protein